MQVTYFGHVGKQTGYGRAGEHLCNALLEVGGIDLLVKPIGWMGTGTINVDQLPLAKYVDARSLAATDVAIFHELPVDAPSLSACLPDGYKRICYTTWEALTMPRQVVDGLYRFDQIWVPSVACFDAIRSAWRREMRDIDSCVKVVPHPYDTMLKVVRKTHDYYSFSWWGAINQRKNPLGVIRAFCHAFEPNEPVQLLIHSQALTSDTAAALLGMTGMEQKDMPKIKFSNGRKELHDLIGDVFVTAARGEGWNLPAFEASVLGGAHVITPSKLGSDDFLLQSSVDFIGGMAVPAMVDVNSSSDGRVAITGAQGLTSKSTWREPDIGQLARKMRDSFERKKQGIAFGYNPAQRYSYETVGTQMKRLLTAVLDHN